MVVGGYASFQLSNRSITVRILHKLSACLINWDACSFQKKTVLDKPALSCLVAQAGIKGAAAQPSGRRALSLAL